MIYQLEKRQEELEKENANLRKQLEHREMDIQEAGTLALASARICHLFEAAQETADEYLEQIRLKEQKAQKLLEQARPEVSPSSNPEKIDC